MTTTLPENSNFKILHVVSKTKKSQILKENLNSSTDKKKHVNKQYEVRKISNNTDGIHKPL